MFESRGEERPEIKWEYRNQKSTTDQGSRTPRAFKRKFDPWSKHSETRKKEAVKWKNEGELG